MLVLYSDERIRESKESLKEIESKEKGQNPLYKSMFVNLPIINMELFILKNSSGLVFNHNFEFTKPSGKFIEKLIDKICTLIHIKFIKLKQKKENFEKITTNSTFEHTIICFKFTN